MKKSIELRYNKALKLLESIHKDLCNENTKDVSKEVTGELASLIAKVSKFSKRLNMQGKKIELLKKENNLLGDKDKSEEFSIQCKQNCEDCQKVFKRILKQCL